MVSLSGIAVCLRPQGAHSVVPAQRADFEGLLRKGPGGANLPGRSSDRGGNAMRARILPAVLLLVPAAAHSGVSATIAEKQRTSTLFVEGSRLRIEDGNRILIFD